MKSTTMKAVTIVSASLALGLTACKKETRNTATSPGKFTKKEVSETAARPVYSEGIFSNDGYSDPYNVITGFYQVWGPFPGQRPVGSFPVTDAGTGTVVGCGAATGAYVYACRSTTGGVQYLEGSYFSTPILTAAGNVFTSLIEEIEIHPATQQVYLLVSEGGAKRIYVVDPAAGTGIATLVTVNGNMNAFNSTTINGYKSGSITFVPDGSGGYEFVFSSESSVYAALGIVSWHFSLSGTNLTSIAANHRTYAGIPGTGKINTTYGNGKLYFARDASTLYSLSLTTNDVFTNEGFSVTNKNDFGYWKAF
ncbi:hypothetical protein [Fluviicola sp.]|uniref:hypothetical protein n=1 Tax=Fluviicola sp. TaxID=1917219 RepID=UPI002635C9BA|nr:hypothetical protein [Fluviicola sp.]